MPASWAGIATSAKWRQMALIESLTGAWSPSFPGYRLNPDRVRVVIASKEGKPSPKARTIRPRQNAQQAPDG